MEIITPENAMIVLEKCADTTDEVNENIVKRTLEVIARNIKEVFDSEVFLKATDRAVKPILLSNELSVREVDVFQAVSKKFCLKFFNHGKGEKYMKNV
jgi:hypothetical protein